MRIAEILMLYFFSLATAKSTSNEVMKLTPFGTQLTNYQQEFNLYGNYSCIEDQSIEPLDLRLMHKSPRTCMNSEESGSGSLTSTSTSSSLNPAAHGGILPFMTSSEDTTTESDESSSSNSDATDATNSYSCKNHNGDDVDWFILVKRDNSEDYRYLSSEFDTDWISSTSIASSGPLKETLQQSFDEINGGISPGLLLLAYNDHTPGDKSAKGYNGHAKGVFMYDSRGWNGFWLMHSMPQFPDFRQGEYSWPKISSDESRNNIAYGQIFFCLTFGISEVQAILGNINIMKPHFYYPEGVRFGYSHNIKYKGAVLTPLNGFTFLYITKSPHYNHDIYELLSNEFLRQNLHVQYYATSKSTNLINTPRIKQICCTRYPRWALMGHSTDHSKWCITENLNEPYFCIGDLNRNQRQNLRGGGVLCFKNNNVWEKFKDTKVKIRSDNEDCPNIKALRRLFP